MTEHYVKFCRHDDVEQHLQLGWMPAAIDGGLIGTPHAHWSIILVWPCGCELRQPSSAQ